MIAALDVAVDGARVVRLAASPPLAAKVTAGPAGPELVLVSAAASLLEGDRLSLTIRLGAGTRLTVRTSAATIAHPCRGGGSTVFDVDAELGSGARLAWLPEPLVACTGCNHKSRSRLRLAADALAVWSETVVLGRTGEQPGYVAVGLDADLDGAPLLRDGLRVGPSVPGWSGPAVLDGARHVVSLALLGRRHQVLSGHDADPTSAGANAVVLPLAGPGTLVRAGGRDAASVERGVVALREAFVSEVLPAPRREPDQERDSRWSCR